MGGAYYYNHADRLLLREEMMTETVINYELLDFTMKYILNNPENHNQGSWFNGELNTESGTQVADQGVCGTSGCFAGWASIFAGWHQVRPHEACIDCNTSAADEHDDNLCESSEFNEIRYDLVVDETGRVTSMATAARESLGLSKFQANSLFSGWNSRARLEHLVTTLHDDPNNLL